jgi:hypothetical protein
VPPELPEKKEMVKSALRYTANCAFHPFFTNDDHTFGLKGIEGFINQMKIILNTEMNYELKKKLSIILISSFSNGSLKDFNRNLFSEFLMESSVILKNQTLEKVSNNYQAIASDWNSFFTQLNNLVLTENNSTSSTELKLLDNIFESEKKAMELLQDSLI